MKRAFEELSDDEWENHSFQLSRVLKSQPQAKDHPHEHVMNGKSLPSIESFAFQKKVKKHKPLSLVEVQSSDDDDDFELGNQKVNRNQNKNVSMTPYPQNLEDDNFKFCQSRKNVHKSSEDNDNNDFELARSRINRNKKNTVPMSPQKPQGLEDDDFEVGRSRISINRSRRLVVVDDSDDDTGAGENGSAVVQLGVVEAGTVSDNSKGADEDDVVGNALQKCDKISATLRNELYGSTVPLTSCEGYCEIEDCAAKIVTQADITAACADEDSDFQPVLKPYQLVGVNFLLLLNRKKIGGVYSRRMIVNY